MEETIIGLEALGYEGGKFPPDYYIVVDSEIIMLPYFSSRSAGMGLLIEAVGQKQDIYLKVEADPHGGYEAGAWDEREWINESISSSLAEHAVCLAF